jgi:hypothetical protein
MINKRMILLVFLFGLLGLCGFSWPFSWMFSHTNPEQTGTQAWLSKETAIIQSQASNIDPKVLHYSLIAYANAKKRGLDSKQILTIIDYSKPSNQKRLWVFDLKRGHTLFNTYVAHGKNSGGLMANSFSNADGSLKSSLGVFMTDDTTYMGDKGLALRLHGLEPGINDHAYERSVVFHGAWYANPDNIASRGQAGRSWGCPAVPTDTIKSLANTIKADTIVVAYYPDRKWLNSSKFLSL